MTDHAQTSRVRPEGSRTRAATSRADQFIFAPMHAQARRAGCPAASRQVGPCATILTGMHLPTAQQRRRSSSPRGSLALCEGLGILLRGAGLQRSGGHRRAWPACPVSGSLSTEVVAYVEPSGRHLVISGAVLGARFGSTTSRSQYAMNSASLGRL